MHASIFVGDLGDVEADAICTSTNPRLSLVMGTGASVRERGGPEVARACEAIVAKSGPLPAGSAHATTAGRLEHRIAIHCVASDSTHRSSTEIVRACVRSAIRITRDAGCASLALPVLASGHAHVKFDDALRAIAEELRGAAFARVVFVVNDPDRAEAARSIVRKVLGGDVPIARSTRVEPEPASFWD